jgi:hypothetical protein|tara:strand:+ start:1846 stop:3135 length:1290 start_codon:yes stop_codon:yes gene_type:complete
MPSAKNFITAPEHPLGKFYFAPSIDKPGQVVLEAHGGFSALDLKEKIPKGLVIAQKADAIAMTSAYMFEHISNENPKIRHGYVGMIGPDNDLTTCAQLLDRGITSNKILMEMVHNPMSYNEGDWEGYRQDLIDGKLKCGVGDAEYIFRFMLPLGSSVFKGIAKAAGLEAEYAKAATYDETVSVLDQVRENVTADVQDALVKARLTKVPHPGFMFDEVGFDFTTKYNPAGDMKITKEQAQVYSGMSEEGFSRWHDSMFPEIAKLQYKLGRERDILNGDGKCECAVYDRMPSQTDWQWNVDENRTMILYEQDGILYALPTNKEVQRANMAEMGVTAAKVEAMEASQSRDGTPDNWKNYLDPILESRGIDMKAVGEEGCKLMGMAIAEVANRQLGQRVFEGPSLDTWVDRFIPYSSVVNGQQLGALDAKYAA